MIVRPALGWFEMRRLIVQANRSAEGIFAYLEQKPELHQTGGAMFLSPLREKINFENVTLQNSAGKTLLEGLTVEIPARTKTSIMALDDEVKTALVCLIPRLIDPKVGRVRIDGTDIRDVTLESVRSQVATVLQADLVFSDSVIANIALGDDSYDLPRIIEAAKVAHAHHFIQDLPNGYDTIIGPLGEYLKPDQQYRIALARAFLHDPAIVIIEEPTGLLEDEVKAFIDDTVARLAPGRTLIMLPHRLSTIRTSDRVILLHNGRLEAAGSPGEIKSAKLFKHLQYVEFNQFAAGEIEAGQMGG
jgi:ABC-type multidrug transport system fused ATPase/permease subunit